MFVTERDLLGPGALDQRRVQHRPPAGRALAAVAALNYVFKVKLELKLKPETLKKAAGAADYEKALSKTLNPKS